MVFIVSRVNDLDLLVSQFDAGTEYKVLDAGYDGLLQMEESLAGKSDYSSIQVISHGAAGSITIGSTLLNSSNLLQYQSQLDNIGHALTDSGDLLLYGCNVGADDVGRQFVETLALMTGADVAASDNVTGGVAAGGDWKLEVMTGTIESAIPVADVDLQQYEHTLGSVDDYILAKMSQVAYYDNPAHPNEKSPAKLLAINAWDELKAAGWQVIQDNWELSNSPEHPTFEDTSWWGVNSGFAATVFKQGNDIVIAYRGTNDLLDATEADVAAASPTSSWDTQFTYALETAKMVKDKYPEAAITVTGHSLGGGLAEVVSQMFRFSGATFDPVGTANVAASNAFQKIAQKYCIASVGKGVPPDFTNYLVEGSPISGTPLLTNDHLGNTETFQVGDWIESLSHFPDSLSNEILTIFSAGTYLAIDYVSFKHEMLGILEFMRQKVSEDGIHYYGTSGGDNITATASDKIIYGYAGNDTINAATGDDSVTGGVGNDTIDGGSGNDTAVFSGNFADYTISLDKNSLVFTVTDSVSGRDGTDQLTHVEAFALADGTRQAGDACTVVNGSYRNEYLYGNDLDNHLLGDGGNDVLEGKRGNDTIDGGSGFDTVIFSGNYADYIITRNADQTSFTITDQIAGRDGTDLVSGVEQYRFAYDDVRDAAHLIESGGGGTGTGGGGLAVLANRVSSSTKLFYGHTMGEYENLDAFAALREDGSVVTWGGSGGDSSSVADKLDGSIDVVEIFSNAYAFAALRKDGSVITWGDSYNGGNSSSVADKLDGSIDVLWLFSTTVAFAAMREDGSVVTWGYGPSGGDSSIVADKLDGSIDVLQVFSTYAAFAALREDGSVVTWGGNSYSDYGGNSSSVSDKLDGEIGVLQVFSTYAAFAALRQDGSVVTWGGTPYGDYGGDSSNVADKLDGSVDVEQVFSNYAAFAALREDGSVVTWGGNSYSDYGGNSSSVADKLDGSFDVAEVFSTYFSFAALRKDGSVITWGESYYGGDSSSVADKLDGRIDVLQVFSTELAFAALREDGSVVTWGYGSSGGDSSSVADKLDGSIDVLQVFSTGLAFAALREDGSVVTWGMSGFGGDSSSVADKLDGSINVKRVFSTFGAFAAVREDGSVVTWGGGDYGYDSSSVADKLVNVADISNIYANQSINQILKGTEGDDQLNGAFGDDILWGNGGNDKLAAMGGNDLSFGGIGNDLFVGGEGEGDDTYVGGEGVDSVKYTSALAGITVDLVEGTAYSTDGNNAAAIGNDVLIDIEHVIAGNFNDILIGNASANSLEGGAGDDWLRGGEGADILDGGIGSDTSDYSEKAVALMVTLNNAVDATVMVGGVSEDSIRNIENLIGGSGNDIFIGDIANNLFRGGAGNDTLDGGIGLDTADYSDKTDAVSVALHGSVDALVTVGGVAEDTIRNIENLIGGSGNDTFIGDAMASNFSGGVGDDTLQAGVGNDTLDGGFDDDTVLFSGNLAEYSISYDFNNATYTVTDSLSDRDGSDLVIGAEFFQFADGVHPVADLIDIAPPYLQAITPSAYATNVAVGADIVFTFTEPVKAATGSVLLQKGGVTVMTIDITDTAQVSFNGSTLTLNPSVNFAFDAEYTVSIGAGAIADLAGNSWVGLDSMTFTTATATDTIAPTVATFSPADAATGVSVGSDIVLTFSETVGRGTGAIAMHSGSSTGIVVQSFDVATSTNISISGNRVTINPTADLAYGTHYFITFDQGSINDLAGNAYAGTTVYDFTTVEASSSSYFNTTGTVNGALSGYGYEKFTAATGGVLAVAPDWSLFLDTATDSDHNPNTFNAIWSWNSGRTDTGMLTFLRTDFFNSGPEEWSATFTRTQTNDDQVGLIVTTVRSGLVQVDATGHPAGIYLGNSTSGDVTAPIVTNFSASDDAAICITDGRQIVFTFSEIIGRGTGTIAIHSGSSTGTVLESFNVASSTSLSVSGKTLTIFPSADLPSGTHYFVTFDNGAVQDTAGNLYSGTDSYDFTTDTLIVDLGMTALQLDPALQITVKLANIGGETTSVDLAVSSLSMNGSLLTISLPGTDLSGYPYSFYYSDGSKLLVDLPAGIVGQQDAIVKAWELHSMNNGSYSLSPVSVVTTGSGTSSADWITGTAGNDSITAGAGSDLIQWSGGNDTVDAGEGYDSVALPFSGMNIFSWLDAQNVFHVGAAQDTSEYLITKNSESSFRIDKILADGTTVESTMFLSNAESMGFGYEDYFNLTQPTFNTDNYYVEGTPWDDEISLDAANLGDLRYVWADSGLDTLVLDLGAGYSKFDFVKKGSVYLLQGTSGVDGSVVELGEVAFSWYEFSYGTTMTFGTGTSAKTLYVDSSVEVLHFVSGTTLYEVDTLQFAEVFFQSTPWLQSNLITGTAKDDSIDADALGVANSATIASDLINGNGGNDTIDGGAGNDSINGGDGFDTAVFTGNFADYGIIYNAATASFTVADHTANRDGTDVIISVETFKFADVTKPASDFIPDTVAPTIAIFSPVDASSGVAIGSDIVLTFSEPIQKGTGTIAIHSGSATGPVVESYDTATSGNLTVSGATLTINPTSDLTNGTHYFITLDAGSVKDISGNNYAGTDSYDFTTAAATSLHDLNGSATFWKTGIPITAVTNTLASAPDVAGTQPIEFRNIHVAADGTRTIEIWETSPTAALNSVLLELALPTGSTAVWQDATGLPSGWNSSANTDKPGQFNLGGTGTTALSAGSVNLGTLTLSAPANPKYFELSLTTGQLGNDTIPAFGISSDSMTTGTDGLYQHLDMAGTYTQTSAKVSGTAESNAIKANDALAALKIAVGMNPNADGSAVSSYQYLAADVNHDGQVKAADALNILKMAVKLSSAPEKEWLFVPESVGSESMSRTHVVWPDNPMPVTLDMDQEVHLIGIVKGDVNGSWVA